MADARDNHLVLTGEVVRRGETRHSPAGLPLIRFILDHRSRQVEADVLREARCRIEVLACGDRLARTVADLAPGTRVRVGGFIARSGHRDDAYRLVLHAEAIETLGLITETIEES